MRIADKRNRRRPPAGKLFFKTSCSKALRFGPSALSVISFYALCFQEQESSHALVAYTATVSRLYAH
jgi:hypothetical protein